MPKIKLPDLSDVDDVRSMKQAPKGLYIMKVKEFQESETGSGSNFPGQPMGVIIMEFVKEVGGKKIKPGTYSNVWHRIPLDDQNEGWTPRLREFIKAIGGKLKGGVLDPKKVEGTLVQVKLRNGKDQNDEYRPEVDVILPADAELPDDAEDEDDDDEDDDDEGWTRKELEALDKKELKEAADEAEVEFPDGKLSEKRKNAVIDAILESQEDEDDEDDDDEDDDEGESENYSEDDLKAMDLDELKEAAEEAELSLNVVVGKGKKALKGAKAKKALIAAILAEQEDEDDEDDDDEDDDDDGYDDMSKTELVKEARSRGIKVKKGAGPEAIIDALRENDAEDEDDDDEDDEDDDDELDPSEMDADALKAALEERGLKTGGNLKLLRNRLTKALESDDDGDPF